MADNENTKRPRSLEKKIEDLAARARLNEAESEKKAAETPVQMFLPGMEEFLRAMPNHLARSSLFAPVAAGRRKMHDAIILVSRSDASIRFSGKQLDEAQADVWMQAMHVAMKQPLGEPVAINRAEFLRSIGRSTQGQNYKWLHRTMTDLAFATLIIEVTKEGRKKMSIGTTRVLHLVEGFDYDEDTETYTLRIDPRWRGMYGNREFALIDWEKRLQFGQHQNMAKALQRLVATSADSPQRYALDWLKAKLEYGSPMRKFKEALASACKELKRLGIINKSRIEDSTRGKPQLVIWL